MTRVGAVWIGPLLALVACECGAPRVVGSDAAGDAGGGDGESPYAPRDGGPRGDPGTEPCADGIRLVPIDVPAFASRRQDLVHVQGEGARVWVAQTRLDEVDHFGRLTVADARTGERLYFSEVELPADGAIEPRAIRRDGEAYEVLFAGQGAAAFAAIARFDGDDAAAYSVSAPGAAWLEYVHAATRLPDGFLLIAEAGSAGWQLVRITGREARMVSTDIAMDVPGSGAPCASAALSEASAGSVVYGAVTTSAAEGQALIGLAIDVSGTEPVIREREIDRFARPACNALAVDLAGAGPIVASRVFGDPTVARHYWLDGELSEIGRWDVPTTGSPVGTVGDAPQAIAFHDYREGFGDVALRVALADAPGVVRGGERPLVNGLTLTYGTSTAIWESAPGILSVGFHRAGVEVISFCEER